MTVYHRIAYTLDPNVQVSNTTYCDLILGKFDAPQDKAYVHITKKTVGSNVSYFIESVNGVRLSTFTGITDFTANNGEGATDYEMLYI
jgi:hypothetical protein